VLPHVPVRQWVLTLPYRLRYRVAWDHELCRAVLGVYARGLLAFYARAARSRGIRGGQTGTVTAIQRCASGLNLNVHFHTLVLDGVFIAAPPDGLTFHRAPAPRHEEVAHVLTTIRRRVRRLLVLPISSPALRTRSPQTRSRRHRRCWPASSAPRSRAASRWARARGRGCGAGATNQARPTTSPPAARARHTSTASICTPTSGPLPTIARAADATPRHTLGALARSLGLLSGFVGNTGFEAPTCVSVTLVLRAIGSLTTAQRWRRIAWGPRAIAGPTLVFAPFAPKRRPVPECQARVHRGSWIRGSLATAFVGPIRTQAVTKVRRDPWTVQWKWIIAKPTRWIR